MAPLPEQGEEPDGGTANPRPETRAGFSAADSTGIFPRSSYATLRMRWLQARSQLFDADAALPTLAAVLDEVRRKLLEHGAVAAFYFELSGETALEGRRGWQVLDTQVRALAAALREQRGAGVLEDDAPIALSGVRSDAFLCFSSAAGREQDRDLLATRAAQLAAEVSRDMEERLGEPVEFQQGFALLSRSPMMRPERAIQRAVDEAFLMALSRRDREEDHRAGDLDGIISGRQIDTLWQPIFELAEMREVGREVLSRGPEGPFSDPERMLGFAERTGRLVQLERLCHALALERVGPKLPFGTRLFLGTSARTLRESLAAGPGLAEAARGAGLEPARIVVELAERLTRDDRARTRESAGRLKSEGFLLAIGDMGAGHSSLQTIVELEPDYLKFDVALVRGIDRSLIKRSLLETLVDLSARVGARVIAEGIESGSELETLRSMGVQLGQGRFLASPQSAEGAE